ncbi:uncharacterized protein LOC120121261 isoform X1 [Hibiscus syriacus]|uniref:uncharacterized protein LOC120121261 isoform X1 n=1 Tax=Hibiscus syriacus TaxID=106335 RepID=UPI001924F59D|nr:uncharacterized protein LOC120121261 isoform X1 [Hibiscus syriacus]
MTARVSSSLEQSQNNIHTGNSGILVTKDLLGNLSKAKADLEFEAGGNRGTKVQFVITKVAIIRWENQESIDGFPKRFEASRLELSTNQPVRRNDNFTRLEAPICSTQSLYQSVCTLDKVKYALERAEKGTMKKRSSSPLPSPPPLTAKTTSFLTTPRMFAAACPGCLLYVIASNTNPRCPRCNSFVPSSSLPMKKPRLDLNASF